MESQLVLIRKECKLTSRVVIKIGRRGGGDKLGLATGWEAYEGIYVGLFKINSASRLSISFNFQIS